MTLRTLQAFGGVQCVAPSPPLRRFGVPPGGAFDPWSCALANALVGNERDAPTLELSFGSITWACEADGLVAAVGPDCQVRIGGEATRPSGRWRIRQGESLTVSVGGSARAYVALAGGVGSTSEGVAAEGRIESSRELLLDLNLLRSYDPESALQAILGPQAHPSLVEALVESSWSVLASSNRLGVRLAGPPCPPMSDLPSEPCVPGAVQVPPSGQPIVIGPDGPTLGGYPKPLVLTGLGLERLAQALPGQSVRFEVVRPEDAIQRRVRKWAERAEVLRRLRWLSAG